MLTATAGRYLQTAADMAAILHWRLPELTPTNPGPAPWLPGVPETLHNHSVWGDYLSKRSQLVAELADQVQEPACLSHAPPIWAAAGSHVSSALIGAVAVWRAANGINPQDPRPTGGGGPLETLSALWKQRLDRDVAHATYRQQTQVATSDRQHTPHLVAATTTGSAPPRPSNGVRAGPSVPSR